MSHYLAQVVQNCEKLGCDRSALLSDLPFSEADLSVEMVRHDAGDLASLYDRAQSLTGLQNIGAQIGASFTTNALNAIGQILPFCRDFGTAITMVERYRPLIQSFGHSKLVFDNGEASLAWSYNIEDSDHFQHATQAIYAGFAQGMKWLLWKESAKPTRLEFRGKNLGPVSAYIEIFDCPVLFEKSQDRMVFEKKLLDVQIPTANPEILEPMIAKLDAALIKVADEKAFIARVYASIRHQIRAGHVTLSATADSLQISDRNFRYALKKHNITFRQAVEITRKEQCERDIANGLPFSIIAQKLAFHDQSAFNRAFKNWFGNTPSEHKRLNAT